MINKIENTREAFYSKILDEIIFDTLNVIDISELIYSEIIKEELHHAEFINIKFLFLYDKEPKQIDLFKEKIKTNFNQSYVNVILKDIKFEELNNYKNKKINYEKEIYIIIYEALDNMVKITEDICSIFKELEIMEYKDISNIFLFNIYNKCRIKYENLVKKKIKKYIENNFIYYKEKDEYLNFGNLQNKIIYDIKNMSYVFECKKDCNLINLAQFFPNVLNNDENAFSKIINQILKILFNEFDFKIMNINPLKLIGNIDDFNKLKEHLLCWIIYYNFFEKILIQKLMEKKI